MKTAKVIARFPEIVIDEYAVELDVTETASTVKAAVSKAIGTLLKSPELKRKRYNTFTLDVQIVKEPGNETT